MKVKPIKIKTFTNLLDTVNEENQERFIADLSGWIRYMVDLTAKIRKSGIVQTEGKQNSKVLTGHMIWVDDGKNDNLGGKFEVK